MLRAIVTLAFAASAGVAYAGCAGHSDSAHKMDMQSVEAQPAESGPMLDDAQRAAYDECLQANMAVATDWSLIEQQCLDSVANAEPTDQAILAN